MVKGFKIVTAIFRLARWQNLLIVALTMILMRYCIFLPILEKTGLRSLLSTTEFILLIVSSVFITAGGYVINDYFDRKTDLINRPRTVILSRLISRRWGMILHFIFTGLGLLGGFYLSFRINIRSFSLLFVGVSGLLWFYSTSYKRQLLTGNLVVAILSGMVPMLVILFELPLLGRNYGSFADALGLNSGILIRWFLFFSVFAFLLTLIREIIKDAEDAEGDKKYGMRTIPIVAGDRATKIIIVFLVICTILILLYFSILLHTLLFAFLYLLFLVILPLLMIVFMTFRASQKKHYHTISVLLKTVMLTGIIFSLVVRYTLLN